MFSVNKTYKTIIMRTAQQSIAMVITLILVITQSQAQGINENAGNPTIIQPRAYGTITEIRGDYKSDSKDPVFLEEEWMDGSLTLLDGSEVDYEQFKYDVRFNMFEFNSKEELRFLNGRKVKQFKVRQNDQIRVFKNSLHLKGFNFTGFIEILDPNDISLYEHHTYEIFEASYVAALDAGKKKKQFKKKSDFYVLLDGRGQSTPTSKKRFIQLLQSEVPDIKEILNERKYKLNRKDDLVTLFQKINQKI